MADLATDGAQMIWEAPQCPFSIEYSARVLDDIRLAVVDAFFSLPRGGAEIGGILLGTHEPERISVSGYQSIECEHATGPSFTLSRKDEAKLRGQLGEFQGQVVGWYHSHTRSEIFLSEADLEIHKRFFPDQWQIAVVLKPHTFQPMRVGFFFRERDGRLHSSSAYKEMLLEALPMRQVPSGEPPFQPPPAIPYGRGKNESRNPPGPIIDLIVPQPVVPKLAVPQKEAAPAVPDPEPPPAVVPAAVPSPAPLPVTVPEAEEPAPAPPPLPLPGFAAAAARPTRLWPGFLAVGVGLALGAVGFQTRAVWLPRAIGAVKSAPPPSVPPAMGLNTLDSDGQLQIHWDRGSLPVRTGSGAMLEITDGAQPRSIAMDSQHLQAGVFTYGRQSEKVEVKLTIHMPDGHDVREITTFLGALPPRQPPPDDPQVLRERDALAKEAAKLKSDLAVEEKRTKKLERSLSEVQKTIRRQQLRRLQNQAPAK